MGLEITKDASLIIRVPYFATTSDIKTFLERNSAWIQHHMLEAEKRLEERKENPYGKITYEDMLKLASLAKETLPPRVKMFARRIGVTYGRITIRNQKTRWGSCSSKGNLNFNCLLMLTPPDVQDYVIVHELCHRKQMNHSPLFWAEVEKILPGYKKQKKWLRDNGAMIIDAADL